MTKLNKPKPKKVKDETKGIRMTISLSNEQVNGLDNAQIHRLITDYMSNRFVEALISFGLVDFSLVKKPSGVEISAKISVNVPKK